MLASLVRRQRTTILFTARPRGLRVSRVVVLDAGAAAEQGAPSQLLERRGAYAAILAETAPPGEAAPAPPSRAAAAADPEALLRQRTGAAEALERRVMMAGLERGKAMLLVDLIGEMKEAMVLEAAPPGSARLVS